MDHREDSMTLTVHNVVYHPSISDTSCLENSNRGIFPTSFYQLVENTNSITDEISNKPIIVMLTSESMIKPIYVTAHEFSASDQTMYLSNCLMNESFLEEGSMVTAQIVTLPEITRLVLRPDGPKFAREIVDPKSALEEAIIERYQVLGLGDTIYVQGHTLEVTELEPAENVITNGADPEVDFLPCWEDAKREKEAKEAKMIAEQAKIDAEKAKIEAEKQKEKERLLWENYQKTGYRFIPFGGQGQKLSGGAVKDQPEMLGDKTTPSLPKPRLSSTARDLRDYSKFSGQGNKLGN